MSGQVGRERRGGLRARQRGPRGKGRAGTEAGGGPGGEQGRGTAHAGTLRPAAEDRVGQPAGTGLLAPHQVDKLLARLGHDGAAAALRPGGRGVFRRRRRQWQPLPLRRGGAGPGRAAPHRAGGRAGPGGTLARGAGRAHAWRCLFRFPIRPRCFRGRRKRGGRGG